MPVVVKDEDEEEEEEEKAFCGGLPSSLASPPRTPPCDMRLAKAMAHLDLILHSHFFQMKKKREYIYKSTFFFFL